MVEPEPERPAGTDEQTSSMHVRMGFKDPLLEDVKREGKKIADLEIGGPKKKPKLTHKLFFEDKKGLDKLLMTFPKIKFKGKGREYEDLSLLLQHYRKWFQELYPLNGRNQFEDVVWMARQVLQEKEKDEDGNVSDPRELLHTFRYKYKSAANAASGAHLSDDVKARIEANRQRALELKKKKEAESGKAPTAEDEQAQADMEEIWRMEEEHAAASKAQVSGAPTFADFDEEEDVFGYGGDFDDFAPAPHVPAPVAPAPAAPAPATHVPDDVRARIEANRLRALEIKKQKEAEASKTSVPENQEQAQFPEEPDFDPFGDDEDVFGFGGFDDP